MVLIFISLIAKVNGHFSYAYCPFYSIFSELLIFLAHCWLGYLNGVFEFLELFTSDTLLNGILPSL